MQRTEKKLLQLIPLKDGNLLIPNLGEETKPVFADKVTLNAKVNHESVQIFEISDYQYSELREKSMI